MFLQCGDLLIESIPSKLGRSILYSESLSVGTVIGEICIPYLRSNSFILESISQVFRVNLFPSVPLASSLVADLVFLAIIFSFSDITICRLRLIFMPCSSIVCSSFLIFSLIVSILCSQSVVRLCVLGRDLAAVDWLLKVSNSCLEFSYSFTLAFSLSSSMFFFFQYKHVHAALLHLQTFLEEHSLLVALHLAQVEQSVLCWLFPSIPFLFLTRVSLW